VIDSMQTHEVDQPPAAAPRHVRQSQETPAGASLPGSPAALTPAVVLHLQRLAGNESVNTLLGEEREELSPVHQVVGSGGGAPLEPTTRSFMEERIGHDFSDVRVHTGGLADESARSIGAQAYTVGTDVVFRSGSYQPDSPAGQRVIAHELTHVVQQKAGPVAGTPAAGGIRLSDPSDSFEQAAERNADRIMSGGSAEAPAPTAQTVVQRAQSGEEEAEEAEVQTLRVQRQADEEPPAEDEEGH
jgi:Domain of unknown function (DUF4157)